MEEFSRVSIKLCPKCGRRASERYTCSEIEPHSGASKYHICDGQMHDFADHMACLQDVAREMKPKVITFTGPFYITSDTQEMIRQLNEQGFKVEFK